MTHTPGPWTASWAENGIAALRDSEGKHFANFRNVRGDEISTVNADLAVVLAAPKLLSALRALIWQIERDDGIEWEEDSPAAQMLRDARTAIAEATAP